MALIERRAQITAYGNELFRRCGVEFARTTEMQRQVCGAFLFGVAYAHGMSHQLKPPETHALVMTLLMDVLRYSPDQAAAFSADLIEATGAGPKDTMNSIIHRGIDGHRQLTTGDDDTLRQNLRGIFEILGEAYAG